MRFSKEFSGIQLHTYILILAGGEFIERVYRNLYLKCLLAMLEI